MWHLKEEEKLVKYPGEEQLEMGLMEGKVKRYHGGTRGL